MCKLCDETGAFHPHTTGRRNVLLGAAGLAASPFLVGRSANAQSASSPTSVRAYGLRSPQGRFEPMTIQRRAMRPNDIVIDILYAGICHSDIHVGRSDWGPANYPVVPGHEMVGRVRAVGSAVTRFKAGDAAGVGCMVDSCGQCANCRADREQNCLEGTTFTYDSPDKVSGGFTYGGYSEAIVVSERFVIRIPPKADLAALAPILCAGITTFSPMQHWRVEPGQRVGVIGLGGLGHMAVKLGAARGADVTVFTTSPSKIADASGLGAREAVLWTDTPAMKRLANSFDFMIATVPVSFPMQPFVNLLKLDATLVNVGAIGQLDDALSGMQMAAGRKSLAGSMIGGSAETQEAIDYCVARNIKADIELIRPDQIDQAWSRIIDKDVRYRFVIDIAAGRRP